VSWRTNAASQRATSATIHAWQKPGQPRMAPRLSAPCTDRPCVCVVQPLRRRGVNHVRSDLSEIAAAAEVDPKVRARVRATFRGSQQSPKISISTHMRLPADAARSLTALPWTSLADRIYVYIIPERTDPRISYSPKVFIPLTRLCRLTQSCAAAHRAAAFPAPLTGRRGRPWECGGPPSQAGRLTPAAAFNY
jgi:hypothetical protein